MVRTARSEAQFRNTRFVAVSGYSRPRDHAKAKLAGFDELVTRPITVDILEKLISDQLS